MASTQITTIEQQLLGDVSPDAVWEFAAALAEWDRHSGTADERAGADYIAATLSNLGLEVERLEHDALLGYGGAASLEVTGSAPLRVECMTHGFGGSTGPDGVVGPAVRVRDDARLADAAGTIAVLDGLPTGGRLNRARAAGVAAAVFILDEHFHDVCLSTVWGTPDPEQARDLPTLPVVSVREPDGAELTRRCEEGAVELRLRAETILDWYRVPIVVGTLRCGESPTDEYVMFSGHHCSWWRGAMDNGAGNAVMLETARVLAAHRDQLRRDLRLCFWPGHTQGRYAGSTWYADNFWANLRRGCVAHINIDSVGASGAVLYEGAATAEVAEFLESAVTDATNGSLPLEIGGMTRSHDQSFLGIGMPSFYVSPLVSAEQATDLPRGFIQAGSGHGGEPEPGHAWWWHTTEDTIDKLDREVLAADARIYTLATLRMCAAGVLPFDYSRTAAELAQNLRELHTATGGRLDLSACVEKAERLLETVAAIASEPGDDHAAANAALMALGRCLNPVIYSRRGPYAHDPASLSGYLPGLRDAARLGSLEDGSDEVRLLHAGLVRERNRVEHALDRALAVAGGVGNRERERIDSVALV